MDVTTKLPALAVALFCLVSCNTHRDQLAAPPEGVFMGLHPVDTPQLLLPEFIATPSWEYNGTFSPDGREFYYTLQVPGQGIIMHSALDESGRWSQPRVAPFSGVFSEYDPLFSPDGRRLYYSSHRRPDDSTPSGTSHNWYVERTSGGWSEPVHVPLTKQGDYYASTTSNGHIYFNIWSTGNIYRAIPVDTGYNITELPEIINGMSDVGDPFISPDESYLIFRGYGSESLGQGDLYISYSENNTWSEPVNLGEPINSSAHEMCPYITADGRLFIFASSRYDQPYDPRPGTTITEMRSKAASHDNGQMNIYYMSADFLEDLRK